MPQEKTSKESLIIHLVDRFIDPSWISEQMLAPAARLIFKVIESLDREQIIVALEKELRTIDLGSRSIKEFVDRHCTSHELASLCLGIGSLLWNVGDLRCVAFGLRNTFMAKDLQPGALTDRSIELFLRLLADYRKVCELVLAENVEKATLLGRPLETTLLDGKAGAAAVAEVAGR